MSPDPRESRRAKSYRARRHAMGGSTTVDTARAVEVLTDLTQRMSMSAIARAIDSSHNYVSRVLRGEIRRISPEREAAILALHDYRPADSSHVSPLGAQRRLRALHALGYTLRQLADETGCPLTSIKDHIHGHWPVIEAKNDQAIREAFERLSMHLPASDDKYEQAGITRARNAARRRGWAVPLAWDDIDNPDETPTVVGRTSRSDIDEAVVLRVMAAVVTQGG